MDIAIKSYSKKEPNASTSHYWFNNIIDYYLSKIIIKSHSICLKIELEKYRYQDYKTQINIGKNDKKREKPRYLHFFATYLA